jgi:hypothetical protein
MIAARSKTAAIILTLPWQEKQTDTSTSKTRFNNRAHDIRFDFDPDSSVFDSIFIGFGSGMGTISDLDAACGAKIP